MKRKIFWIFVLLFVGSQNAWAQRHTVSVGTDRLQLSVNSVLAEISKRLSFPREFEVYGLKSRSFSPRCARGSGIIVAAKDFRAKAFYKNEDPKPNNWTVLATGDTLLSYFVADATPNYTIEPNHFTVPVSSAGALKYWKYRPPVRIVNNEDLSTGDWTSRDVDGPADMPTSQIGVAAVHTLLGITVTERAFVFDNADFAIVEYVFKNSGETGNVDLQGNPIKYSSPIKDCYIGIKFWPIIANRDVAPKSTGWVEGTDDWVDYVHDEDGDLLRVLYGWDGDAGDQYQGEDDEGDPLFFSSGLFTATQYPGMAVLHADKSPDDPTDNPDQPRHFRVSSGGIAKVDVLSAGHGKSFEQIYNFLSAGPDSPQPFKWAQWKVAGKPADDSQFWHYGTSHATDEFRFNQMGTLSFGPYNFNLGDSVRVVLCTAVGTIGWEEAIDLGDWWRARFQNPTAEDIKEKRTRLRSGRDSLFAKIKEVKQLFEPKFQANNGDLWETLKDMAAEIGVPLAWPSRLELTSVVGGISVEWDPVDGAAGYRVYRRDRKDFDVIEPRREPAYSLVHEASGNETVWLDSLTYPVKDYWYAVTAISSDGVESSRFITRSNPLPAFPLRGSASPFDKEFFNLENIHVVPNPYHSKSWKLYDVGENTLKFFGLPANCRIRIFSQSGTLVFTGLHQSVTELPSNTFVWDMRTTTAQTIASGLYIYAIDQCRDFEGNALNATKVDKFVVIR